MSDSCCSPAQTNPKGGSCCCCGPFIRRFISKKEELEYLENYKDQLKKELAGLEERIKEMTGK